MRKQCVGIEYGSTNLGQKPILYGVRIFFCEWVIKSEVNMRECLYVEHKTKERLKLMK
jgi:hypothetical protein